MNKVKIMLQLNERNKKTCTYGYMRPLKTLNEHVYRKNSKDWNKDTKKKTFRVSITKFFHPCVQFFSKKNNRANIMETKRKLKEPKKLSASQLNQLYFANFMLGKKM